MNGFNEGMDDETTVHPQSGGLSPGQTREAKWMNIKRKKPDCKGQVLGDSIFMGIGKTRTENKSVVVGGQEWMEGLTSLWQ